MSSRMVSVFVGLALVWEASAARRFVQPKVQPDEVSSPGDIKSNNGHWHFLDLSSSPNASLAKPFLDWSLGAGWATLPVVGPDAHPPLLPSGVKPFPSLFKIDKSFDFHGVAGSAHVISGMGAPLVLEGNFLSRHFGHDRIKVYAHGAYGKGEEQFQMVTTKHLWNPFKLRASYRILKPSQRKGWQEDEDVLFTINRDWFGRGVMWMKDEYRIYQGRERGGKMVYYCVQSWWGWETRCWHNKLEYESGRSSLTVSGHRGPKYAPCAILSQVVNGAAWGFGFVPDKYYLFVNPGEDAALLSVLSALVDTTQARILPSVEAILANSLAKNFEPVVAVAAAR